MKRMKRWFAILTAMLLVAVMATGALAEAQPAPAELFGKPWYNITVIGNLPDSAAEAKDDLYSYYNYDFIAAHQDAAVNAVMGGTTDIQEAVKDALADESLKDPAVEQLRIFYEQALDFETRKKGNGLDFRTCPDWHRRKRCSSWKKRSWRRIFLSVPSCICMWETILQPERTAS